MDASIIIVNWNGKDFVEKCLRSLEQTGFAGEMEVILVDNASSDGSQAMVREKFPWVKLICSETNLGFARANNVGIRKSTGRYICLVNSDVEVLPHCMDNLIRFMDEHPKVGMGGPKILNGDRTLQSSCRRFPNLWNNFCDAVALPRLFPKSRFFAGEHMAYFAYDRETTVDVLVGCFIAARREAVEKIGLLDEDFFIYGEDIDWCWRCWEGGWEVTFFPGAEAIHYRGGSSSTVRVKMAVEQQKARLQLWHKHRNRIGQLGIVGLLAFENGARWMATKLRLMLTSQGAERNREKVNLHAACLKALREKPWKTQSRSA